MTRIQLKHIRKNMVKLLEEDATNNVEIIYKDIKNNFSMVPNLFKAMAAIDPNWLELNWYRENKSCSKPVRWIKNKRTDRVCCVGCQ